MALGEHEVLSKAKAIDVFDMGRQKNPSRLGRQSRLAAAADGGRVAHREKYSSERYQPTAEPPLVTIICLKMDSLEKVKDRGQECPRDTATHEKAALVSRWFLAIHYRFIISQRNE
jgi:hypothetical protein